MRDQRESEFMEMLARCERTLFKVCLFYTDRQPDNVRDIPGHRVRPQAGVAEIPAREQGEHLGLSRGVEHRCRPAAQAEKTHLSEFVFSRGNPQE